MKLAFKSIFLIIGFLLWLSSYSLLAKAPTQNFTNVLGTNTTSISNYFNKVILMQYQKPIFLQINSIGVNANIEEVGIEKDGSMEVPHNFKNVGWLKTSSKLGQNGNLILSGHFDTSNGSPAIFYNLEKVKVGDKINVITQTDSGLQYDKEYIISQVYLADPNNNDHIKEAYKNTKTPTITLITCNGIWDSIKKEYSSRVVVKGELVN